MRILVFVAIAVAICAVSVCDAQPGFEAVMTIDGIPDPIEIRVDLTGSRAASPLTSRAAAPSRDRGSAVVEDLTVTKNVDKASPKMGLFSSSARRMREVTLEIRPVGGSPGDRTVIKMKNAVITRITEQPALRGDHPTEAVTFSCQSIEWETQAASTPWDASPIPYTLTPRPR
jgi:type VI protein secretion system component Hcp